MSLDTRTLTAHADAWQAEGRLRERLGGGAHAVHGARLSSSGLPYEKWNSGDVFDAKNFDVEAARAWYATRAFGAGVPWGMRVPAGDAFPFGKPIVKVRNMALERARFAPAAVPAGVTLREASVADAARVAQIDAAAFDAPLSECTEWNTPHLGARGFFVVLAYDDATAVGTATAVVSHEHAGPCVTLFGVGVLAAARRRGIGAAMTARLIERAFAAGATLAHLCPNDDAAARLYARLGFVATRGIDVYVDL